MMLMTTGNRYNSNVALVMRCLPLLLSTDLQIWDQHISIGADIGKFKLYKMVSHRGQHWPNMLKKCIGNRES